MIRALSFSLLAALAVVAGPLAPEASAQSRDDLPDFLFDPAYYSSKVYEKKADVDGNEVVITVFNYGLLGGVGEVRGEWPKGSDDTYVGDVLPIIVSEVPVDTDGDGVADDLVRHVSTTRGPGNRGIPTNPDNPSDAWTFEPKPGFASNRVREDTNEENDRLALSTDPQSWPNFWPDQPTWIDPTTGRAQWNGFFGRNQFSADLESYFWADDTNDREIQTEYPGFTPDPARPNRGGLGLELKVRSLQWSQFLAQDAIFWLYEVTNTSQITYPRVAVGLTVGTLAGGDGDSQDDLAFFDQANRIVYSWDNDNSGNESQPVGYVGYGFLESPGNSENGIDDDGDGDPSTPQGRDVDGNPITDLTRVGSDNTFQQSDFQPRTLASGDPLVLIDEATGRRSIQYVPASGSITVESQGRSYTVRAGDVVQEVQTQIQGQNPSIPPVTVTEKNLIDDDLDGIIDEDVTLHFERRAQAFGGGVVTLPALKYKNYVGFARAIQGRAPTEADSTTYGLRNLLIDESRANGVDEDGDWNPATDDVGADGQPGTGDQGEGNGRPDSGEPNFDDLDVTESDQVGLSSFFYFFPSNAFPLTDDERVWDGMTPGFFTTNEELQLQQQTGGVDGDFVFGSGYFSLEPGETLRFSMALVFGDDLEDITTNTQTIQEIYNRNYQFARPPDRPTLRAVGGDGQVTLYWDSIAEQSFDPALGEFDFEGYRLYKSTDPNFQDVEFVTDAFGNAATRVPFVQFDRADGIRGIYTSNDPRTRGVGFNLGTDTGLRYSYVDTDVNNGQTYYYAITAYDRGSPDFFPAENNILSSQTADGKVVTGDNVVEVRPNAPVAGYTAGRVENLVRVTGTTTGEVFTEVLNPQLIPDGAEYEIVFDDDIAESRSFSIRRNGETVVTTPLAEAPSAVVDGIRFVFNNDVARIDQDASMFLTEPSSADQFANAFTTVFQNPTWQLQGAAVPYDYEIRLTEQANTPSLGGIRLGSTGPVVPSLQTNVTVYNRTLDREAAFVFIPTDGGDGTFTASTTATPSLPGSVRSDALLIYDCDSPTLCAPNELSVSYIFRIRGDAQGRFTGEIPNAGDRYLLASRKPFSTRDAFAFSTVASGVDVDAAQAQLDAIRVVPNPYVASASWERPPPRNLSGRGERRIDFIHLPQGSVVRIYDVRGSLIRELVHDSGLDDGTVSWDLRTRENLETAYGIYFYHIDAPGVGETTGKLALIK